MVHVEYKGVTKRYEDGFEAVTDLNLEVKDGEFLVLLGPSGCGKSTTLRMLAGLEDITEGDISIDGMKINHLPAGARGLGMVFQSYALYPHMSISDNLSFGLRMEKGDAKLSDEEIKTRVNEAAEMLDLSEHLDKKPKELSGGQRQRVAIARALSMDPSILLFDEPTSSLDPETVGGILKLISDLALKKIPMVIITHEVGFAQKVADRIIFMENGEICLDLPVDHAFKNKTHHSFKKFISEIH